MTDQIVNPLPFLSQRANPFETPLIDYGNAREYSYGTATTAGIGTGLFFTVGTFSSGGSSLSVVPETNAFRIASGAGGRSAPMVIERFIERGEKIEDIISEAKGITWLTGNETALVTLNNNRRALVSGGSGGIDFAPGQVRRIFGHTHPDFSFPSVDDADAIFQLGNSQQRVFNFGTGPRIQDGIIVRPKPKFPSNF